MRRGDANKRNTFACTNFCYLIEQNKQPSEFHKTHTHTPKLNFYGFPSFFCCLSGRFHVFLLSLDYFAYANKILIATVYTTQFCWCLSSFVRFPNYYRFIFTFVCNIEQTKRECPKFHCTLCSHWKKSEKKNWVCSPFCVANLNTNAENLTLYLSLQWNVFAQTLFIEPVVASEEALSGFIFIFVSSVRFFSCLKNRDSVQSARIDVCCWIRVHKCLCLCVCASFCVSMYRNWPCALHSFESNRFEL